MNKSLGKCVSVIPPGSQNENESDSVILVFVLLHFHSHSDSRSLSMFLFVQPQQASISIAQKSVVISERKVINFLPIIPHKGMNQK